MMISGQLKPQQSGSLATIDVLSDDESPVPSPRVAPPSRRADPRLISKLGQVILRCAPMRMCPSR